MLFVHVGDQSFLILTASVARPKQTSPRSVHLQGSQTYERIRRVPNLVVWKRAVPVDHPCSNSVSTREKTYQSKKSFYLVVFSPKELNFCRRLLLLRKMHLMETRCSLLMCCLCRAWSHCRTRTCANKFVILICGLWLRRYLVVVSPKRWHL